MHWILDFDDTLALGPNTYAIQTVMPGLIQKYALPYQPQQFDAVLLSAQEQANLNDDEAAVIQYLFDSLGWDIALKDELIHRTFNEYQPRLFDDTRAFLDRLAQQNDTLMIVSNNNYAPHLLDQLGIAGYFTAVFTPKQAQKRPKPHHDLWENVRAIIGDAPVQVVGDDPWSDGLFSQGNAHAHTWILDRLQRYGSLHRTHPYRFVQSLLDIQPSA